MVELVLWCNVIKYLCSVTQVMRMLINQHDVDDDDNHNDDNNSNDNDYINHYRNHIYNDSDHDNDDNYENDIQHHNYNAFSDID